MGKRILICDDDILMLELLKGHLQESGYEVETEENSINVYKDISYFKPDLIILDQQMPSLEGDVIIKALKGNIETKEIPIILCSSHFLGKLIAEEAGADYFLPKPIDLDRLNKLVADYVPKEEKMG